MFANPFSIRFDIRNYGAKGDGIFLNTAAFLAATNAARDAGGGLLQVSGSVYLYNSILIILEF